MSVTATPTPTMTLTQGPGDNGNGVPWERIAVWALGVVGLFAAYIFNSNIDGLKKAIDDQSADLKQVHQQISDARLELVQKIDAVDKSVTIVNGKVEALNVSFAGVQGFVPRPQPPSPLPKFQK